MLLNYLAALVSTAAAQTIMLSDCYTWTGYKPNDIESTSVYVFYDTDVSFNQTYPEAVNLCNFNKTVEWEGRSNSCEFPDEVNFTTTIKPFASFYPPNAYVGSATAAGAASEGLNNWDCVRGNPGVWFDNVYPFWQCKQEFVCTPNNAT